MNPLTFSYGERVFPDYCLPFNFTYDAFRHTNIYCRLEVCPFDLFLYQSQNVCLWRFSSVLYHIIQASYSLYLLKTFLALLIKSFFSKSHWHVDFSKWFWTSELGVHVSSLFLLNYTINYSNIFSKNCLREFPSWRSG